MLKTEDLEEFTKEFMEDNGSEEESSPEVEETPDEAQQDEPEATEETTEEVEEESEEVNYAALWDGLSDAQREELTNLQSRLASAEHAFESTKGRQKALHVKVNDLEAERAALEKQLKEAAQPKEENEEVSQLREEFPEFDKLLKAQEQTFQSQLEDLKTQIPEQPVQRQEQQQPAPYQVDLSAEVARLRTAHPDFEQIKVDPNYATWLSREPAGIRALADSQNADDAIALIDRFKGQRTPKVNHSDELGAMKPMPTKGQAINTGGISEDNFDALVEHFGEKIRKENER